MHSNAKKRQELLVVLYQARQAKADQLKHNQWTPIMEIKNAVEDIDFALSVLVELGFVELYGYKLRITGQGILACEAGQHSQEPSL